MTCDEAYIEWLTSSRYGTLHREAFYAGYAAAMKVRDGEMMTPEEIKNIAWMMKGGRNG